MFLSTVNGRYWVELVDPVTADWESLRMNHGIAKEFREAMLTSPLPFLTMASTVGQVWYTHLGSLRHELRTAIENFIVAA